MELPLPSLDALPLGAHLSSGCPQLSQHSCVGVPALTDEALFASCGVRVAFTGRAGGVSTGDFASLNCALHVNDDPQTVNRNRQIVMDAIGAPDAPLIIPKQVHGTHLVTLQDVSEAAEAMLEAGQGCDGVIVGTRNVAALLNFADCLPVIIVSPDSSFAVVHAGWRGAVAHIVHKACLALSASCGCNPGSFNAYIGPHIRSECFEVGDDVAQRFLSEFGDEAIPRTRHVSLADAVRIDLMRAGVDAARIADSGICTKCRPDEYFSYRASSGRCGRHCAVAIAL